MSIKRLVILPTYNENQNISRLVRELLGLKPEYDILVIDDSSPDGTADTVRKETGGNKRVFLVSRAKKLGLGSAYLEGFSWAVKKGYDRVFTMDADLSHQPKYLAGLDGLLDSHELSIGSRYVEGGKVEGWPMKRIFLSKLGNYYARTVLGVKLKDLTSGFMGISRALIEKYISSDIKSEGYSFLLELKNIAVRGGYQVQELPIIFVDRIAGVSKISKKIIFEAVFIALKLRFSKIASDYRGNKLFKIADRYIGIPLIWLLGVFTKKGIQPPSNPREILVIKLSAMGDSILLIPALRALKNKYGGANITTLCTDINSAIFRNCPYVNKIIVCDLKKLVSNPISIFSILDKQSYDIAVDFDQWLRFSPLLAVLSGAKTRLGFKTEGQYRHYAYSGFIDHDRMKHEVDCFLELLSPLGISAADNSLEFRVGDDATARADELFKMILMDQNEPFAILHPETPAHGAQRHWAAEKYIELGTKMVQNYRFKILVTGTKKEISSNVKIVSAIGPGAKLLPPSDILTLAAVIAKARLVVCGNTGIMHLACALHKPVVAIHGPTDPVKWGPRGEKCRVVRAGLACSPCLYLGFEYKCENNTCMDSVKVEDVLQNVKEVAIIS